MNVWAGAWGAKGQLSAVILQKLTTFFIMFFKTVSLIGMELAK